jgi:prepilin-type N-terminal cleavage/methylation domain-containing protein
VVTARARMRGYTLLEIVISMAVFGMFLLIVATLTSEMRGFEKRMPIDFMSHPQVAAVVGRLRRDVEDVHGANPYPPSFGSYVQTPQTLILETVQPNGGVQTIVWDFSTPGAVVRHATNVGITTDWTARGLPPQFSKDFAIDAVNIPGRPYGVRVTARDQEGRIAIDQLFQPRAHD